MPNQVEVQRRIADNIRVWAKIRKVTLKSLQTELGMKKGSFFERLSGKTAMTITELTKLAELLNVGVADLVETPSWVAGESNPEPADIGASSTSRRNVKNGQTGQGAARSTAAA